MLEIWLMVFGNYDARKDCLGHNFQIPRKSIYHGDFNSTLTNFNGQSENIVNNSDFIDTNVTSSKNNLNTILDNAHRNSERSKIWQ